MKKSFLSIKYKIIIISVLSIFVCSILISLFSYQLISGYLEEKAYENKVNTMVQAAKNMIEKGSNLVKQTHIILENDSFHSTLEEVILNPDYNYAKAQSNNHGFKNLDKKGVITIEVSETEENKLEILLEDNGSGIDIDKIPEGFGIRNTNKRLKLHYGEGFGLFICPQDIGVLIKIIIPKEN